MIKEIAQRIFKLLGFKVIRIQKLKENNSSEIFKANLLQFGTYQIETACENQFINYTDYPRTNKYLARIASFLSVKGNYGIIDIGANCGDTAAIFRSNTNLPILCIEGDDELYEKLEKNMTQCSNITLIKSYVGEKSDLISVNIEKKGWNNTLIPMNETGSLIQITRLDDISHPWLNENEIILLKIDTEGFDVPIIFGAKKLIEKSSPIISFEFNRENMKAIGETGMRVFPFLQDLGYENIILYDSTGRYFLSGKIEDLDLLNDIYKYTGPNMPIYYIDILAFPKSKNQLFRDFLQNEKSI